MVQHLNTQNFILKTTHQYSSNFFQGTLEPKRIPPGLYKVEVPAGAVLTLTTNCGSYSRTYTGAGTYLWNSFDSQLAISIEGTACLIGGPVYVGDTHAIGPALAITDSIAIGG